MNNEKEIKDLKNIMEYVDVERQLVVFFGDDFFDDNYICISFMVSKSLDKKQIENEMVKKLNNIEDTSYKFVIFNDDEILVCGKFYFNKSKIAMITCENLTGDGYTGSRIDELSWEHL